MWQIATSWSRSRSRCSRLSRIPRCPRNGFASARHRQVRQRLVPADVEGAQRDPPAAHGLGDRVVLAPAAPRRRAPRSGRGTGTRCAPVRHRRPRRERGAGVGHRSEVGGHDDSGAVAGHGRLLGQGELPSALLGQRPRRVVGTPRAAPATGRRAAHREPPSRTTVVPSGMLSTSRPAATTTGMSRARARIAACDVGLPCGEDDAGDQVRDPGRPSRRASGRGPPGRPAAVICRRGLAGQRPQHLVADRVDVRGALPQVGVGQAPPTRVRPRPGSRPRRRPPRRPCRCGP